MPRKPLHVKIKHNVYNINHDRFLQKSHSVINFGLTLWIGLLAILATYYIEGHQLPKTNALLTLAFGSALIFFVCFATYHDAKEKRKLAIDNIKSLNPEAAQL